MRITRGPGSSPIIVVLSCFPGRRFDVREFHHELLKVGYVPLDILEEVVIEWIESKRQRHRIAHAPEVTIPTEESTSGSSTRAQCVYLLTVTVMFTSVLCR